MTSELFDFLPIGNQESGESKGNTLHVGTRKFPVGKIPYTAHRPFNLATFTSYKAQRAGKLLIKVPPKYSSQECAVCGNTQEENRATQALFLCKCCGHTDNADHNAARLGDQTASKHNSKKQETTTSA